MEAAITRGGLSWCAEHCPELTDEEIAEGKKAIAEILKILTAKMAIPESHNRANPVLVQTYTGGHHKSRQEMEEEAKKAGIFL